MRQSPQWNADHKTAASLFDVLKKKPELVVETNLFTDNIFLIRLTDEEALSKKLPASFTIRNDANHYEDIRELLLRSFNESPREKHKDDACDERHYLNVMLGAQGFEFARRSLPWLEKTAKESMTTGPVISAEKDNRNCYIEIEYFTQGVIDGWTRAGLDNNNCYAFAMGRDTYGSPEKIWFPSPGYAFWGRNHLASPFTFQMIRDGLSADGGILFGYTCLREDFKPRWQVALWIMHAYRNENGTLVPIEGQFVDCHFLRRFVREDNGSIIWGGKDGRGVPTIYDKQNNLVTDPAEFKYYPGNIHLWRYSTNGWGFSNRTLYAGNNPRL